MKPLVVQSTQIDLKKLGTMGISPFGEGVNIKVCIASLCIEMKWEETGGVQ